MWCSLGPFVGRCGIRRQAVIDLVFWHPPFHLSVTSIIHWSHLTHLSTRNFTMKPEDEHADAVVRVCSYHRIDFDLIMVRSRPNVTEAVQDSLQTTFDIPPQSGLGDLDCLPAELMTMVLKNLDILSYFRFRRVNRYARILSTSPREYQLVAKYGVEGLRALLRSDCARRFTIMDLYRLLTTPSCALCGKFGGFLFLLTATRCCFTCLHSSPSLSVISTTVFARKAGIPTHKLSVSYGSTLRTVSGHYSILGTRARRPKKLILKAEAIAALDSQGVLKEYSIGNLLRQDEKYEQRFMGATSFPWYDTSNGKVEYGISCKGCHVPDSTRHRGYDYGYTFSTAGFLSHFATCVEARDIWAKSKEVTVPVQDSAFILRGGYHIGTN